MKLYMTVVVVTLGILAAASVASARHGLPGNPGDGNGRGQQIRARLRDGSCLGGTNQAGQVQQNFGPARGAGVCPFGPANCPFRNAAGGQGNAQSK